MSYSSLKRSSKAESLLEKILKEIDMDQYQDIADTIVTEEDLILVRNYFQEYHLDILILKKYKMKNDFKLTF